MLPPNSFEVAAVVNKANVEGRDLSSSKPRWKSDTRSMASEAMTQIASTHNLGLKDGRETVSRGKNQDMTRTYQ